MKKHVKALLGAVTALGMFTATHSALAADGAALFTSKGCAACHGPTGNKSIMPVYPNLAGQNAPYLLNQMKLIKSGERAGGQTAVMKPIIASVTDEEMSAMADWLSKQNCK